MTSVADGVAELEREVPEVVRLAEEVSLAVTVDAALLRQARLDRVPGATAATEADLWLSPFVRSRSADGFVLEPAMAMHFRRRLARSPARLQAARDLTAAAHAHLSPLLQMEEELLWLSVRGDDDETRNRITEVLRSAVVALVRDHRAGVANWAARSLPELPATVRGTETAEMLAVSSLLRLSSATQPLLELAGTAFPDWLPWVIPPGLPRRMLHVRLLERGVEVHAVPGGPGHPVPVPETEPLVLELIWPGADEAHRVTLRPGEGTVVPGTAGVRVRTAAGEEYEIGTPAPFARPARPTTAGALADRLTQIANEAGARTVAAAWYDYETQSSWYLNSDEWFQSSNLIQLAVLIGVFGAAYRGQLVLDSRVHVKNRFYSAADGEPYRVNASREANSAVLRAVGRTMKVNELAYHMITLGSPIATNLLLDLVGMDEIRETLRDLGVTGVELLRGMDDERAWEKGLNNRVTAQGMISLLRPIEEGTAFNVELSARMLEALHDHERRSGLPAGLPESARVANISGTDTTLAHDAAIVYLPGRKPYVLSLLSQWEPRARTSGRWDTVARSSRAVYEHLTSREGRDAP